MISDKCLIDDDDEMDETLDEAALAELEFKKKRETEIKQFKIESIRKDDCLMKHWAPK